MITIKGNGLSKGIRISVALFMIGTILLSLGMMSATTTKKSVVFYEEGIFEGSEYYVALNLQKFDDVQAMGGMLVVIASNDTGFVYGAGGFAVGEFQVTVPETGLYVVGFLSFGNETAYYVRVFRESSAALIPIPIPTLPLLALSMLLMVCGTGGFLITSREHDD